MTKKVGEWVRKIIRKCRTPGGDIISCEDPNRVNKDPNLGCGSCPRIRENCFAVGLKEIVKVNETNSSTT